jgi:hypothetical protein
MAWSGALIMIAATVAFVAYIAVAGLDKASELAGVVGALVALAGLGLALYGRSLGDDPKIDPIKWNKLDQGSTDLTKGGGRPVIVDAIAPSPPWTVRGHGLTYSVIKVTRTMSRWGGDEKPSINVTADVTRTKPSDGPALASNIGSAMRKAALNSIEFRLKIKATKTRL